jgi:hypothetical protein
MLSLLSKICNRGVNPQPTCFIACLPTAFFLELPGSDDDHYGFRPLLSAGAILTARHAEIYDCPLAHGCRHGREP